MLALGAQTIFVALLIALIGSYIVNDYLSRHRLQQRLRRVLRQNQSEAHCLEKGLAAVIASGNYLATKNERQALQLRLRQAGFLHKNAVAIFLLARLLLLLCAWGACVYLLQADTMAALLTPMALFKQIIVALLAVRLSEWWLNATVAQRLFKLRQRVPESLELLTLCAASGMALERAMLCVADELQTTTPLLANEFHSLSAELSVNDNRSAVLRRYAQQCGIEELSMMAKALLQSIKYGTPLVDCLRGVAIESRLAQLNDIKEKAGAVPARMSVPLIILVLFPTVILLAAPALISLIRSLSNA